MSRTLTQRTALTYSPAPAPLPLSAPALPPRKQDAAQAADASPVRPAPPPLSVRSGAPQFHPMEVMEEAEMKATAAVSRPPLEGSAQPLPQDAPVQLQAQAAPQVVERAAKAASPVQESLPIRPWVRPTQPQHLYVQHTARPWPR
eukprot:COSAG05_NODE_237_length_13170_cov_25.700558_4_plen_145_part_00